jgi:hypothetical protein
VDAELLQDPLGVDADRLRLDAKPRPDLGLAQARREELQDLALARREPKRSSRPPARGRRERTRMRSSSGVTGFSR